MQCIQIEGSNYEFYRRRTQRIDCPGPSPRGKVTSHLYVESVEGQSAGKCDIDIDIDIFGFM